MSYRSIKRVLGETSLERKCRFLFGACLLLLISASFWLYGRRTNTIIDEHRRVSFVNFGEVVQSHLLAVDFIRRYAVVPVARKFATVVTSAAGYPLDKTYYQTVKGMVAPIDILAPGGDLLIVSECAEGMGSLEYVEAQQRLLA